VAQISRSALLRNASAATGSGVATYPPAILRADAWGHGARTVEAVLAEAGLVPASPPAPARAAGATSTTPAELEPEELFGLPGSGRDAVPAMRLVGTVLATKDLRAGEGVSYGYLYRAPADTRIALVTGGYAQGVVRALGNAAFLVIGGVRHPIIGRVAMDVCVVEIADAAVGRGDEAVFFGDPRRGDPSIAQWRDATRMTAAELVTAVGLHANRRDTP
jgi:alanine racemase